MRNDTVVFKKNRIFLVVAFGLYFVLSIYEAYINGAWGAITKYYILFLSFGFLLLNWQIRIDKITFPYIIWLIYKCVSLLWSSDFSLPKAHFISQIGMVFFLLVITTCSFSTEEINAFVNTYFFSSLSLAALCVFFSKPYRDLQAVRQVVVLFGVRYDPNNIGTLIMIGFSIAFYRIISSKKTRDKVMYAAFSLICLLGGLKTGSRATLVAMALVVFLILFLYKRKTFKNAIIFIVLLFISVIILKQYLPVETFERLFMSDYGDGSGRLYLWGNLWEAYTKDILTVLLGIGWGSTLVYSGTMQVGHNTFLTMLCDVGLIGSLIFYLPIVKMSVDLMKKKEYLPVVLLVSQFAPAFFIDAINKRFFWNSIFILIIYYQKKQESLSNEETEVRWVGLQGNGR